MFDVCRNDTPSEEISEYQDFSSLQSIKYNQAMIRKRISDLQEEIDTICVQISRTKVSKDRKKLVHQLEHKRNSLNKRNQQLKEQEEGKKIYLKESPQSAATKAKSLSSFYDNLGLRMSNYVGSMRK